MKLTILGAGTDASGLAGIPNRYPPGFLVEWDKYAILFDCSEAVRFRLEQAGFEYARLEHLAISHSHPDHYALPQLIQSMHNKSQWSQKKLAEHDLHIYAPAAITDNYLKHWRFFQPNFPAGLPWPRLRFHPLPQDNGLVIGNGKLFAAKVFHGQGRVEALAFRLELPEGVFVYSGDTGDCAGIREIAAGAKLFVCECSARIGDEDSPRRYGHLNPRLAGEIAKGAGVEKLIFFHYTGLDGDQALLEDCRRSGFAGEIIIGKDFQTFLLPSQP